MARRDYTILDLLVKLVEAGGSDLHLTVGVPPTIRVNGKLVRLTEYPPLDPTDTKELAFSIIREDQRKRLENDWELDFGYSQRGIGRFRCNIFYQRGSIALAMRALPERIPTMEELRIPPVMKEKITLPRGLILVTGATGTGKTTSLAAMLNVINETRPVHIVTL